MLEQQLRRARIVSSVAATVISLACGTNYVYSAWAPQFADRLLLSSTESNLIGLAGNLGMYTMGVPVGMFVDHRGPRPAVIAGSILLGLGYFPLHQAYDSGSGSVPLLCLFSYMTGLGGCMAFAASVKTSALNWPRHRGTATAFPLAAFGLSAFFFSLFGSLFFPGNPSAFLMSLACGTFGLTFVGFFFLRVLPPPHHGHHHHRYLSVPGDAEGGMTDSQQLRRASSDEAKLRRAASHDRSAGMHSDIEPGMFYAQSSHRGTAAPASSTPSSSSAAPSTATRTATTTVQPQQPGPEAAAGDGRERRRVGEQQPPPAGGAPVDSSSNMQSACISATAAASGTGGQTASASSSVPPEQQPAKQPYTVRVYDGTAEEEEEEEEVQYVDDERTSLMSRSSSRSSSSDSDSDIDVVPLQSSIDMDRSHRVDYRGWKLLRQFEFWQLFSIMGILTGIGLMTINNIGNDVTALWRHWDDSVDDKFLIGRQQMHVSILSVCSFAGRLLSGAGSDFIVKILHSSRIWCLVISSIIFSVAQVCALNIENPNYLGLVSGFSGLGYGFLFGVFPSIVAESFGIHGLSQNWGFMTLSPVVSGNVFNLFYGAVYDSHSIVGPGGERSCIDGLRCYRAAYVVTLAACGIGLALTLWVIRHQQQARLKELRGRPA